MRAVHYQEGKTSCLAIATTIIGRGQTGEGRRILSNAPKTRGPKRKLCSINWVSGKTEPGGRQLKGQFSASEGSVPAQEKPLTNGHAPAEKMEEKIYFFIS